MPPGTRMMQRKAKSRSQTLRLPQQMSQVRATHLLRPESMQCLCSFWHSGLRLGQAVRAGIEGDMGICAGLLEYYNVYM